MAHKGKSTAGNHKSSFSVQGQSLQVEDEEERESGRERQHGGGGGCEDGGGAGGGPGGVAAPSVAWSSQPNSPKDFTMVEQVMTVNRSLVQQIDALRLRLQVDSRHFDVTRQVHAQATEDKLRLKESQLGELKEELRQKEDTVKSLTEENHKKRSEIQRMQHTINALQQDVEASRRYVEDIQKSLNVLQEEKDKLESGAAYREKEDLILKLSKELAEMRGNLSKLDRELAKAKEVIAAQGGKLRLLEHEKHNLHLRFKDELARASQTMKHEVEKMREVMKSQWEEMRSLRQQNEGMRTDLREIKDLLLADAAAELQGPLYTMGALKPSLPTLSRYSKRIVPGKKKPLG